MPKEFKISTIKDLVLKIPPAKLPKCIDELKTVLLHMQGVVISASIMGGSEAKEIIIQSMPDYITWVDDGKDESTIRFTVDDDVVAESIVENKEQEGAL